MVITWHGKSCFKIQSRDGMVITDPFKKTPGSHSPRLPNADVIVLSEPLRESPSTEALVIDGVGEYEKKSIFIRGIPVLENQTIYHLNIEGITLGYLGPLANLLQEEELDLIEEADILFVPIGGHRVLNHAQAVKLISEIEPRIVIPMFYQTPDLEETLDSIEPFLKEMGIPRLDPLDRFKIQKSNLPQEEMTTVLLKPQ